MIRLLHVISSHSLFRFSGTRIYKSRSTLVCFCRMNASGRNDSDGEDSEVSTTLTQFSLDELIKWKKKDLQSWLQKRYMKISGCKSVLVHRILRSWYQWGDFRIWRFRWWNFIHCARLWQYFKLGIRYFWKLCEYMPWRCTKLIHLHI